MPAPLPQRKTLIVPMRLDGDYSWAFIYVARGENTYHRTCTVLIARSS